jgi:hypothetical protein
MEAILKDLNEAYVKLNDVIKAEAKKSADLDKLIADAKLEASKLLERESALSVKEAKYKEFENVQVMRDGVSKDRSILNAGKKALSDGQDNLSARLADLDIKQKELDNFIAIFKQKNINCDKMKAELDKDRAEMKQSIIAELQKGLK